MKILLFGTNGLLGLELSKVLESASHQILYCDLTDVNIRNELMVNHYLGESEFDLLIYAKGYEDVFAAEENEELAYDINAVGALNLAKLCQKKNIPLMYVSTSYVFDGMKDTPYAPGDPTNPINAYGKSKLAAENNIRETINNHYIIRTNKLFGVYKPNFIDEIIDKAKLGQDFKAITDIKYTPTWTFTVSKTIEKLIDTTKLKVGYGIYHCTNSGYCSDYDFIADLVRFLNVHNKVFPIKYDSLKHKVNLPKNSTLDCSKSPGIRIHWLDAFQNYLKLRGYIEDEVKA